MSEGQVRMRVPDKAKAGEVVTVRVLVTHRNFRRFWVGQTLSLIGTWMQTMAQGWLALELSNSAFVVGLVAASGSLPILLFSLPAGVLVDRRDRLRLVKTAQTLLLVEAVVLWLLTLTGHISVGWIILLALAAGGIASVEIPARQSLMVDLVGREDLRDAIALNSSGFNLARIVGPAVGAVVITGPICAWKGLFVIAAPRVTVNGLTFRGAAFSGGNAAGIRAEGGDLRILRARFEGNQNGILTKHGMQAFTLTIEDSVFVGNGALIHECAHGIYAGHWALVAIRRTRFEGTRICHHVKSRAARTEIEDSAILDTPGNQASYLVDIPNGGDLLLRNSMLRKGPDVGNPIAAVMIGAEGVRHPTTSLRVIGNRFENLMPRGTNFVENRTETPVLVEGNTIQGTAVVLVGPGEVR